MERLSNEEFRKMVDLITKAATEEQGWDAGGGTGGR
jgi:hypothetical protein